MSVNRSLFTSDNEHYCTPPQICARVRKVLRPTGSGRRLLDPGSNDASQVGADLVADGVTSDGLALRWDCADGWFNNPAYGQNIDLWTRQQAYWGRERGVPGIALLPARDDTQWCQRDIFGTADAWVNVAGRLSFWLPIPLALEDAAAPKKAKGDKAKQPYYLRRWFPLATDADLPPPFRSLAPGIAVGPELGENGKPQSAPFPSLIAFWADPAADELDPMHERGALRELLRLAGPHVDDERWHAAALSLVGRRMVSDDPVSWDLIDDASLERGGTGDMAVGVRRFARVFGSLGTLTVARGPLRGVYQAGRR